MPSDVSPRVGWFDRFAGWASALVSRAWFFAACVLLVLLWAPSLPLFGTVDTWQLVINTATTIITFLLVALIQNTATRDNLATQHKLNSIADALADLLTAVADDRGDLTTTQLRCDVTELRAAVGLEQHESS